MKYVFFKDMTFETSCKTFIHVSNTLIYNISRFPTTFTGIRIHEKVAVLWNFSKYGRANKVDLTKLSSTPYHHSCTHCHPPTPSPTFLPVRTLPTTIYNIRNAENIFFSYFMEFIKNLHLYQNYILNVNIVLNCINLFITTQT